MHLFGSTKKTSADVIAAHTAPSFPATSLLASVDAIEGLVIIHPSDLTYILYLTFT